MDKKSSPITLTFNGKELLIREFEIQYGVEGQYSSIDVSAYMFDEDIMAANQTLTMNPMAGDTLKAMVEGVDELDNMMKEDSSMGRCSDEPCETACIDEGRSLAKQVKVAKSTPDEKLLRKFGVVREDGTLTERGKDLILNLAFEEEKMKSAVVSALQDLEAEHPKDS